MSTQIRRRRVTHAWPRPGLAARLFATRSHYFSIENAAQTGLNPGTSDFSIDFWMNILGGSGTRVLFCKGATSDLGGNHNGYLIFVNASNQLQVAFSDDANTTRLAITGPTALTAGWHHCVFNFDRDADLQITVNNVVYHTAAISTRTGACNPAAAFRIGSVSSNSSPTPGAFFDGLIDIVRYRSRLMSTFEITRSWYGGYGLVFPELTVGERIGLVSDWEFDGFARDSQLINHLTNNNGVIFMGGKR